MQEPTSGLTSGLNQPPPCILRKEEERSRCYPSRLVISSSLGELGTLLCGRAVSAVGRCRKYLSALTYRAGVALDMRATHSICHRT